MEPARPDRPVMLFDGECGFCRVWIERWRERTGSRVEYVPFQESLRRFPQVEAEQARRAVQLVLPDGSVLQGAAAVVHTLKDVPGRRWTHTAYHRVPGFAGLAELVYRRVARNRALASRLTRWWFGDDR